MLLLCLAALSGCAQYTYSRTADGCEVTVYSMRAVSGGALNIGADCELQAGVDEASGSQALQAINGLLDRMPK